MRCDKCSATNTVRVIGEERICIICGWADINYEPPKYKYRSKGVRYVATYNGDSSVNKDTQVLVRIRNSNGNHREALIFEVKCPWCGVQMDCASKVFHYKCDNKHRISIENREDGTILWK
tara:strand:+ start:627 stop:986 length:360 start_codon:yes stop_codon:yes gene_type:complete